MIRQERNAASKPDDNIPTFRKSTLLAVAADVCKAGAKDERQRIRRLIKPALRDIKEASDFIGSGVYDVPAALARIVGVIDAATKAPGRQARNSKPVPTADRSTP